MWQSTHASSAHWSDKNNTCQAFFHKKNCAYLCHCNGFESTCSPSCNIKDINGIPCILVIYRGSLTMQGTRFPRRLGLLDPCKALCSFKTLRTINPVTLCHLPKRPKSSYHLLFKFTVCYLQRNQTAKLEEQNKCKDFALLCLAISLHMDQL